MSTDLHVPAPEELEDLVTAAEIGRRLGVTRQRASQLAARPGFPKPLGRLGHYVIWRWSDVRAWLPSVDRVPPVEIYSATDPAHIRDRQVWYWVQHGERVYPRTTDYHQAEAQAEEIRMLHDGVIIDRSDKGSGYLLWTIGKAELPR